MSHKNHDPVAIGTNGNPVPPQFSVHFIDWSVEPTVDFYSFAAGNWLRTQVIPEDKSVWGAFNELSEYNFGLLHYILEEAAQNQDNSKRIPERQVGDFYASGMNVESIEQAGLRPLSQMIQELDTVDTVSKLTNLVAQLQMKDVPVLFSSYSRADRKNSGVYSFYIYQGGLSLPDKEYYLAKGFEDIREKFREHVAKMFMLTGIDKDESVERSQVVWDIESFLAKNSRNRVDLRDQEKNYNRVEWDALISDYPNMHWDIYLNASNIPRVPFIVVGQPEYFKAVDEALKSRSMEEWKTYLKWHILHYYAQYIHAAFESEDFNFFHRVLLGQLKPEPRWKRIARLTDQLLGEALGQLYVEKHFSAEARSRVAVMVRDIKSVLRKRISELDWMTQGTKDKALVKLDKLVHKIGYPERFRDYSSVAIRRDDFLGNIQRLNVFERQRHYRRVGSPVDRGEWIMSPPTVNAYYSPSNNEIVLPAGILQPPFFDVSMDDAVNYGAIGTVIGHELTHGFDDQGRRFDAEGNLSDWWSPEDEQKFAERAEKVVGIYGSLEAIPQVYVNGRLTLGENIADLGGVRVAYDALQLRLRAEPQKRRIIDGLTPEQRFFVSYAQMWHQLIREQELRRRLAVDPHSPGRFRGSVPVMTHPEFPEAFKSQKQTHWQKLRDPSVW